ncbi:MAG: hypothetical protein CMJ58_02820 [Planctomycetaceae bacterium]|nr:hypothetical protein [Planctomycetaceae bacterium]
MKLDATSCWLCEARLADAPARAAHAGHAPVVHPGFSFSISTLLLIMTLTAIVLALTAAVPGLGVPFCVLLAPALVRTAMVVSKRKETGKDVSLGRKVSLLAGSVVVSGVIMSVVSVAAVGSFCGVCLGLAAATNPNDTFMPILMLFSGAVALVVSVLLLRLFAGWIRRRYRRDVEES